MEVIGYGYASLIFELLIFFLGGGYFLSGRCPSNILLPFQGAAIYGEGEGSATQGGALGYVLLPLRGDAPFQGAHIQIFRTFYQNRKLGVVGIIVVRHWRSKEQTQATFIKTERTKSLMFFA
ncbi:MAG: hypothetical protein MRZ71_04700 [Bacteroidales bacterium]|nr:hypothetical protein [Bacteroidales bacterium]